MTGSERWKSVGDEYPHHLDTSSISLAFRIAIGKVVEENSENVYSSEELQLSMWLKEWQEKGGGSVSLARNCDPVFPHFDERLEHLQVVSQHASVVMVTMTHQELRQT